jgi:hypothetical protein
LTSIDKETNKKELAMSSLERAYARCSACNTSFYPLWRVEIQQFESLCHVCLPVALKAATDQEDSEDSDLQSMASDVAWKYDTGSLLVDDEYHGYGQDAMGELGYLDSYGEN